MSHSREREGKGQNNSRQLQEAELALLGGELDTAGKHKEES